MHFLKIYSSKTIFQVLDDYFSSKGFVGPVSQSFESRKAELIDLLLRFDRPPFTIQRLAELLTSSRSQISATHKYMNSVEKQLFVVSTVPESTVRFIGGQNYEGHDI